MSLRARVVVAVAMILFASAAVGVALAGWQARKDLRSELTAALMGGRQTVETAYVALPRSQAPGQDLKALIATFDGNRHVTADLELAGGRVAAISHPWPVHPAPGWFRAIFHPRLSGFVLPAPSEGALVRLEPAYANDVAAIWAEFVDLALVLAASLVLGAALIWLGVGRALAPLAAFSEALLRIGAGDWGLSVRERGPAELVRLGRSVNEMSRRLAAMQARNRLLEDQMRTLQDEERADLARDLHDEIGPHLFSVNLDAALIERALGEGRGEEAKDQVKAIKRSVAHMQALVRDILGRLRPVDLVELGLTAAIGELIAFWRARHPDIAFEARLEAEDGDIAQSLHETLYRIIQEAVTNAVRHAKAERIEVALFPSARGEITLEVKDDGTGRGETGGAGLGLIGMRERAAAAGGVLSIDRGSGGWRVLARIPNP
ncbi:MAG: HAMP domain-containing sensor histidine kinase, partial [Caulobacteraceae bacterium]